MFTFDSREQTEEAVLAYFKENVALKSCKGCGDYGEIKDMVERQKIGEYVDALFGSGIQHIFLEREDQGDVTSVFLVPDGVSPSGERPGAREVINYFSGTDLFQTILDKRRYYVCVPTEFADDAKTAMAENSYGFTPDKVETDLGWVYFEFGRQGYQERFDPIFDIESKLRRAHIPFIAVVDRYGAYTARNGIGETSRFRAGYRVTTETAFRSTWEANVARILDYKGIPYEYEKQPYSLETVNYLPDFFLGGGIILEVKGVWDADSRRKVYQFTKNVINFKLFPIDADMYIDLKKKFSLEIDGWEEDRAPVIYKQEVTIVGMYFFKAKLYDGMVLGFKREPDNEYDRNAILATDENGNPVGHLAAEWAAIYAPKMDAGMKYTAVVTGALPKVGYADMERTNTEELVLYEIFK